MHGDEVVAALFGSALSHNLPVQANENIGSTGNSAANAFATTLAAPPPVAARPTIPANGIIPFTNNIGESIRPQTITLPRVDQFNVAVQQQFGASANLEIAYVGNIGERVYPGETFGEDLNQYGLRGPRPILQRDRPHAVLTSINL